jgi:NosR/NirI family transcriptional regulator, nitrous oxide reductase regulator
MAGEWRKLLTLMGMLLLATSLGGGTARAVLGEEPRPGETVTQYLTPQILTMIFPGADKIGEVGGTPPAAPVYKGGTMLGYIFSTWDVTQSKGFSNRPIVLLVGLDLHGRVAGVRLVHHSEPIAILGLRDDLLHAFTQKYKGHDIAVGVDIVSELSSSVLGQGSFSQRGVPGAADSAKVDAVSRATTSSVLMSDAIIRGARIVARSRGILPPPGVGVVRVDLDRFAPKDWPTLAKEGAIARLHLTYSEVRAKFSAMGAARATFGDPDAAPDDSLLELDIALVTPAEIGVNLLGETWYNQYTAGRAIDDQIVLVATSGAYSLFGGDLDHADAITSIELAQGDHTIKITPKQIRLLPFLHASKAPDLAERALVFFKGSHELDPAQPWQAHVLVAGKAGDKPLFARFTLDYRLPAAYVVKTAAPAAETSGGASDQALGWRAIWSAHLIKIGVLAAALTALTAILVLQNRLSRNRRLHRWVRLGFLSWTLVWLGWYAGAQLTIVNLLTYLHTLVTDFRWSYVLADPLVAILSVFTLVSLMVWGRAPFCGWLCPFGALQELANTMARRLRLRQFDIPEAAHRWLIWLKYLLFIGLVAASFLSWNLAMAGAEVEPFKAAIILRFMTEWPMVVYALALIAASLFVERFYCRFACPLGGGLALLGRLHILAPLKRRQECGSPCHLCENVCPVGAIKRTGAIDYSECFYCLDCQVTYYDDTTCPPLIWRRRRERDEVLVSGAADATKGAAQ